MQYEQLKLEKQLCHRLYMASNSIIRAYREPLKALDITYPQYLVMMALWEEDEISIAHLLQKTVIDGSAMTQILKKMGDKGLLQIVKDQKDKRKRFVKLSPKGLSLKALAVDIPAQIACQFSRVDSTQAQQLMQLLDNVIHGLQEERDT